MGNELSNAGKAFLEDNFPESSSSMIDGSSASLLTRIDFRDNMIIEYNESEGVFALLCKTGSELDSFFIRLDDFKNSNAIKDEIWNTIKSYFSKRNHIILDDPVSPIESLMHREGESEIKKLADANEISEERVSEHNSRIDKILLNGIDDSEPPILFANGYTKELESVTTKTEDEIQENEEEVEDEYYEIKDHYALIFYSFMKLSNVRTELLLSNLKKKFSEIQGEFISKRELLNLFDTTTQNNDNSEKVSIDFFKNLSILLSLLQKEIVDRLTIEEMTLKNKLIVMIQKDMNVNVSV